MANANITVENTQLANGSQAVVVHISGQLDESNVDEKIQVIYKAVEATPQNLIMILDLESLEYMNSKSIGYITDLYGKITENGGKIVISGAKANISDILQVVGLTQLIQQTDSIEAAKALLSGNPMTQQTEKPVSPPVQDPTAVNTPTETAENETPSVPTPQSPEQTVAPTPAPTPSTAPQPEATNSEIQVTPPAPTTAPENATPSQNTENPAPQAPAAPQNPAPQDQNSEGTFNLPS